MVRVECFYILQNIQWLYYTIVFDFVKKTTEVESLTGDSTSIN